METMNPKRAVTVKKFPAELTAHTERFFLREAEICLDGRRPALVLDCAGMRCVDRHGIWLMLRCLEEAMKRNGDVRLAEVAAEPRAVLEAAGLGRLFRIYKTSDEAIASFQQPLGCGIAHQAAPALQPQSARHAA